MSKRKVWEEYGGTKGLSLHHFADLLAEGRMDEMFVSPSEKAKERAVKMLPTPRTSDSNGTGEHGTGGPDLRTQEQKLLPTLRANKIGGYSSERFRPTLEQEVKLLPTPTTQDAKSARSSKSKGGVNHLGDLVKGWSGESSPQQSEGGSESSDDPPPTP